MHSLIMHQQRKRFFGIQFFIIFIAFCSLFDKFQKLEPGNMSDMDALEYSLREGATVEKSGDGKGTCFTRITDMIEEYDANHYPGVDQKMYRYIRNTDDRLKIVCHRNLSCVSEHARQCSFFLIAASKDNGDSCKICKNVCIRHSCMDEDAGGEGNEEEEKVKQESAHQLNKKRKAAEYQEGCREAWKLMNTEKYFLSADTMEAKSRYLEEVGVFEAGELKDLDAEHVEKFAGFMKEVPCRKLKRLLSSNMNKK